MRIATDNARATKRLDLDAKRLLLPPVELRSHIKLRKQTQKKKT